MNVGEEKDMKNVPEKVNDIVNAAVMAQININSA